MMGILPKSLCCGVYEGAHDIFCLNGVAFFVVSHRLMVVESEDGFCDSRLRCVLAVGYHSPRRRVSHFRGVLSR